MTGARNAEKLIGADPKTIVRMPKPGDKEGQQAMFKQLGMPDKPDAYDLGAMPQGQQPDVKFQTAIRTAFHTAGLSADQAKSVSAAYNTYAQEAVAAQTTEYNQQVQAGENELRGEWKAGYDSMINKATQTAKMLGFSAEMVDGIEGRIGYAGTLRFLANLSSKIGEDSFVSDASGKRTFAGAATPQDAQKEWEGLKMDKDFISALLDKENPGHKGARDRQTRLFGLMYPE